MAQLPRLGPFLKTPEPDFYASLGPIAPDGVPITLDELTHRAVREAVRRNVTQDAAAKALGISTRTIRHYLSAGPA